MVESCIECDGALDENSTCVKCHKVATFVDYYGREASPPNALADTETQTSLLEKAIPLNRYNSLVLMKAFDEVDFEVLDGETKFTLVTDTEEIEVFGCFAVEQNCNFKAVVSEVIARIQDFDNIVQLSCRRGAANSSDYSLKFASDTGKLDQVVIRSYESREIHLTDVFIEQADKTLVTLSYIGTKINTAWDAKFQLVNGEWLALVDRSGWEPVNANINENL